MKLEHSLIPYTKINPEWLKGLNIRHDTIKLEETIGVTSCDMDLTYAFLGQSPKATEIKTNKLAQQWKHTINKMKRQPTEWGKIFANDVTNRGLISKIYK